MSFHKRLSSGEFVVLAEMDTPKGVDISEFVINARRLKGRVDAVTIPDMGNGVMRMTALGGGVLMQQQGMEAIIHVCCRDRNQIALQGELLSAYALGIQNLIVDRGEDLTLGDHIDAKPVKDLDELGLLGAMQALQKGADLSGIVLNGKPSFIVGCTIAPFGDEKALDTELEIARKKVEKGACFFISPPVFDPEQFLFLKERARDLNVPIIPTVILLKSVGMARYMTANLPGVKIAENTINRIRRASDRILECFRIAGETISALRESAQGVKIVTLGWEHRIPGILDSAGL
ncbi:MAG: methylenetetrahydrofolate reductase [Deltaproteobacteria bacterium]|nr:methylenetetrahydrofolate reductase [Deltaproteobacteria bacterium]